MKTIDKTSRRNRLYLNSPAELAIYNAMGDVEKIGADIRLTNAYIKLKEAKELVADFIDGVELNFLKSGSEAGLEEKAKVSDEDIEKRFPCEVGQSVTMEKDMSYDDVRNANYYRRQGAKAYRDGKIGHSGTEPGSESNNQSRNIEILNSMANQDDLLRDMDEPDNQSKKQ